MRSAKKIALFAALFFFVVGLAFWQWGRQPAIDPATLPMKYKDCNILLVSFDALQAAHVGSLGNSRNVTPTLDRIAGQGFNFRHCYSVASWTVPASMTWFTGVYPSEHGLTNKFIVYQPPVQKIANLKEISPHLVTLAQVLKENGFATVGFTGNAGVSGGFGYEQGFDTYQHERDKFGDLDCSIGQALAWLKTHRNQKFFMFLHGYDCHGQHSPTGGYDYRFVDKNYDRRFTGAEQEHERLREEGLDKGALDLRDSDVKFWRAIYDEKINRADDAFAGFLREFAKLGLEEKTLFVLTSDHGTEFFEHRRLDHGFTLYDEQLHVPLIIRLPGQTSGKVVADRVSSIDVMPTILELVDVKMPPAARNQLRGASLVPAFGSTHVDRDVFAETDYRQYTYKRAIITQDGWKLIYTLENKSRELYNLDDDGRESKNRADTERDRADLLEKRLFQHFKAIGHDLTARRWEVGFNPVYTFATKPDLKK
jgi:arylsulfatase A-like enzyme